MNKKIAFISFILVLGSLVNMAWAQSVNSDEIQTSWAEDGDAFLFHQTIDAFGDIPGGFSALLRQNPFLGQQFPDFKIDPAFLKAKLSEFSGATPIVIQGKETSIVERGSVAGRNLARLYLAQEYAKLGFKVSLQSYNGGANFVAERTGIDPSRVLILSAHLDSVGNAGADDDGAGTISVLAIAAALSKTPLQHNLRIVGFDQEEKGMVGSGYYVASLVASGQLQQVIGDINLEMTAYDRDNKGAFHVMDCNRPDSVPFTAAVMGAVKALNIPLKRSMACTDRSDHARFWQKNKGAVVISEDFFGGGANPCYHQACDKTDILNFNYMANITRAVASATAALLEVRH